MRPDPPRELHPSADRARKAWKIACAFCHVNDWLYLLESPSAKIRVQCPQCLAIWVHDTGFGAGGPRPALASRPLPWPIPRYVQRLLGISPN
jgi:hypothetical protein